MKRFKFPLDVLLKVKKVERRGLHREINNINKQLLHLTQELEEVRAEKRQKEAKIQTDLNRGIDVHTLKSYVSYNQKLSGDIKRYIDSIESVNAKANKLKKKYIKLKKEIEVLKKLRKEQLDAYLYDLEQKRFKEIEDIISSQVVRGV